MKVMKTMNRKVRNRLIVGATVMCFVAMAWVGGTVLGITGTDRWILRGVLWAVALLSGFIVHRLLGRKGAPSPEEPEGREIDDAFAEARDRLAASDVESGRISRLPVVLVTGPAGSTKTTLVERAGVETELVAGDVYRGEAVTPTDGVNLWYGEGTVFVEAASDVLTDPGKWESLTRRLRPERLGAALGRGRQAPRVAVVCFPCGEFAEAGASEAVPAAARRIRERLAELSAALGIRLPVYVLFTKADRLPHFEDFVRNLSREEAREVLGATLPLARHRNGGGAYAEREAGFLTERFGELFHSLSRRRLELLGREADEDVCARLYEFPREFRKARDLAVRFLVELGRPSQLGASPFVRGFYFTGVRPVVVEEGAAPARPERPVGGGAPVGATMVFDRAGLEAARRPAPSRGARRVPEWVFLPGVLRRIVLADGAARAITAGGTQVNFLRRALAGAALAVGAFLLAAVGLSFLLNAGLQDDVRTALERAGAVQAASAADVTPTELRAALEGLDPLRRELERLRGWQEAGPPWRLRWGLYQGSDLLPPAREAYFRRFAPVAAVPARDSLESYLAALPSPPDGSVDYDRAYDALKAYRITTEHPERSTEAFLTPVLTDFRLPRDGPGGAGPDGRANAPEAAGVDSLLPAHYAFYARELPIDDPYDVPARAALLADARQYLVEASGEDAFYATMVSKAESRGAAIRFRDPSGVVLAPREVSGAFTAAGWRFVQTNLEEDLANLLARDDWTWVVGEARPYAGDLRELADSLRSRYERDYARRWREFLASARVAGFGSLRQAARVLGRLSESDSPLLHLLALASLHTDVDTLSVGPAFRSVRSVAPPDTSAPYADRNRAYVDALAALGRSAEEAAEASGDDRIRAAEGAAEAARDVEAEVGALERTFPRSGLAADVGSEVQRLLLQPAARARAIARAAPDRGRNAGGARFCRQFADLAARYPFSPGARPEAAVEAFDQMLEPGDGLLWAFYEQHLSDLLTEEGGFRTLEAGDDVRDDFLAFFRRASAISRAFYQERSGPAVQFLLKLETSSELPEVTFNVDGQEQTWSQTFSRAQRFRWVGEDANQARITGRVEGEEEILRNLEESPWALFRLLDQATWSPLGGRRYRLDWGRVEGVRLEGELTLLVDEPILNPDHLAGLDCVSRVVR